MPERLEPRLVLDTLARSTIQTLGRDLKVVVRVHDDCPSCVANASALHSLLTNFIATVASAMPSGGEIVLYARPVSDGSMSVEFVVRNEDQVSHSSARVVLPAFVG